MRLLECENVESRKVERKTESVRLLECENSVLCISSSKCTYACLYACMHVCMYAS